jgi:hypothetical protein
MYLIIDVYICQHTYLCMYVEIHIYMYICIYNNLLQRKAVTLLLKAGKDNITHEVIVDFMIKQQKSITDINVTLNTVVTQLVKISKDMSNLTDIVANKIIVASPSTSIGSGSPSSPSSRKRSRNTTSDEDQQVSSGSSNVAPMDSLEPFAFEEALPEPPFPPKDEPHQVEFIFPDKWELNQMYIDYKKHSLNIRAHCALKDKDRVYTRMVGLINRTFSVLSLFSPEEIDWLNNPPPGVGEVSYSTWNSLSKTMGTLML